MNVDKGDAVTRTEYKPYGETWVQEGDKTNRPKFNSQELDPETGYYFYNARYYEAEIGRFITADNIIPDEYSTQSWNRYSYVRNNPIKYKDPTGHVEASEYYNQALLQATESQQEINLNEAMAKMGVEKVLLEKGTNPRSGSKLISNKAVVIHWTDSDPAQKPKDTRNYWQSHNLNASAHYIVGNDGKAIQTLPTDEQGKHVGAYSSGNHPVGVGNYYSSLKSEVFGASNPNSSTIGIEVVAEDRNTGNFSNESEKTTSKIAATILYNMKMASGDNIEEQKNSIKNGNILLRHGDITDKKCPKGYMNDEDAWESFKDKVVTEYENIYKEKNKKE